MSKKRQRWSKELIIERIHKRHSEGLSLSVGDVMCDDRPLFASASCQRYFNSYEAAIKAAGLDYEGIRKQARWSKELVVERIQERHWKRLALNSWAVQANDQLLFQATIRCFGSWKAAIEAAGLDYEGIRKQAKWSKELVIERIQERHRKGFSLNSSEVLRDSHSLYRAACRHFGSWKVTVEAAGFVYPSTRKQKVWSKEVVIECIRERHRNGLPLSHLDVKRESSALVRTAYILFDSWKAAIEAAGFAYSDVRKNEAWSRGLVIERIRERHRNGLPLNARSVLRQFSVLIKSARLHFGSWEAATRAAGFEYANIRKQEAWSTQLIIERIRERYWRRLSLSYVDMQQSDPALAGRACHYFGSWEAAVEAAGFSYPRVCKVRRTKDLSRSSESEDRVTFLQNLGSRKKSREQNPREEKKE